jgi:hypothetical protein
MVRFGDVTSTAEFAEVAEDPGILGALCGLRGPRRFFQEEIDA